METATEFQAAALRALKTAAPLTAFDTAAEGLRRFPDDVRLRQLRALALARTGATREANKQLHELINEGHTDEETIGTLARTYKDLSLAAPDVEASRAYLQEALRWYLEAYRVSGGYWTGINAATLAFLSGANDQSRELARRVHVACLERRATADADEQYWILATLGESELLLGNERDAIGYYRQAASLNPGVSNLVTTRRNARLILRAQQRESTAVDACFHIPRVAVFSGHLIDRAGRDSPRFPAALESQVREIIQQRLRDLRIGFAYASAGNGGDILFLESAHALGAALHVVLPYNRAQFQADSVDFVPSANWAHRYQHILTLATEVVVASEQRMLGGAMSYEYGFLLLDGMAAIRAEELETELVCVALWDGEQGDGPGGTATAVAHWRKGGRHVEIIDLPSSSLAVTTAVTSVRTSQAPRTVSGEFDAQLVGIVFADVAGFSKLTEDQIPIFVESYLGAVAAVLKDAPEQPLLANTWGDGLYFVFSDVGAAGRFALRMSAAVHSTDWGQYGLPRTLALRTAVHAGPAYACRDPVTGGRNFLGAHVALAARIEPVTPSGVVYASGAFAALAKAEQVKDFDCSYVGRIALAKGYGTLPMYVLHAKH